MDENQHPVTTNRPLPDAQSGEWEQPGVGERGVGARQLFQAFTYQNIRSQKSHSDK